MGEHNKKRRHDGHDKKKSKSSKKEKHHKHSSSHKEKRAGDVEDVYNNEDLWEEKPLSTSIPVTEAVTVAS